MHHTHKHIPGFFSQIPPFWERLFSDARIEVLSSRLSPKLESPLRWHPVRCSQSRITCAVPPSPFLETPPKEKGKEEGGDKRGGGGQSVVRRQSGN